MARRNIVSATLSGCRRMLGRYGSSIAFRLTLNYGLLTILTTLILLLFIYLQVTEVLRMQLSGQITHAQQRLAGMLDSGGIPALIQAIEMAIADELDGGEDLYLLTDPEGRPLAGNIEVLPGYPAYADLFELTVHKNDREVTGHFKQRVLPDAHVLLIGHETAKISRVNERIVRGIGLAFALALGLVVVGAYIFHREFERRVSPLRSTARQVGAGLLSQRVPQADGSDELSHLSHDVNAMLDKIEQLMLGVRHVSDTIAHDLRTPLMRIQGRLRAVQRPGVSHTELAHAVHGAAEEVDRLNHLLGKLLQISELEAGVRRMSFASCRLDIIAADVVDLYSALAEDRGICLTLHAPQAVPVLGDAELLANACANILDNGLKYAHKRVHVTVIDTGGEAVVTIADDGLGVPEQSLERLGERFYRPDTSQEGLGLGLASVKAIVSLHEGSLHYSVNRNAAYPGLEVQARFPRPATAT